MPRETKLNLLFLGIFLVIALPGAAILFAKKLQPDQRAMYLPAFVRVTTPYNHPQQTADNVVRSLPPLTLAWVDNLARERLGRPALRYAGAGDRLEPVVSRERRFELIAIDHDPAGRPTVWLIAWMTAFGVGEVDDAEAAVTAGGKSGPALLWLEGVAVDEEVVQELKREGYVQPPTRVGLVKIEAIESSGGALERLELRWRHGGRWRQDVLELDATLLSTAGGGKDSPPVASGEGDD